MNNYKSFVSILCSAAILSVIPFQELIAQDHGDVNFGVDCEENVKADFDNALAKLHNMIYVAARQDFEEITKSDPNCAMAHWGIATTLFQPLWGTRPSEEDLHKGWQHIVKARDLVGSDREKYLIESTAGFFKEPETADFWTRIERWAEGLEKAYNAYPDDIETASLYGLSRLTLAQRAKNRAPLHDETETILRDIYEQVPTHPGAIHYSIHATDVDGRAENALDIVEAYGRIAPDNPHALHMPSHIYVRLGDWPSVIAWNKKSARAALNHTVNGAVSHHFIHAKDYLVYAYLQRGEDEKITPIIDEIRSKEQHQGSFVSAFHFAAIPARLAVEQKDWKRALELEPRTPDYLPWDGSPWPEGLTWYAKGLGAVHTGDIPLARKSERKLRELHNNAHQNGAGNMATYIEIDRRVLEGWIEHAEGNEDKAVELMKSAADLEETVEKHPVTPGALQPPYEALGDLLLELNRPAEALAAYEDSDEIWPGRLNTLVGVAVSAKLTGDNQKARAHIARLLNGSGNAEISSSESDEILGATNQ